MSKKNAAIEDEPITTQPTFVWLDYQGKQGAEHGFDHDGEVMFALAVPFALSPGLNKLDAVTWAAGKGHPEVAQLCSGKTPHIRETDAELTGYESTGDLRDLVERTTSGDVLEHILQLEMAKPQMGPVRIRRNADLLELLEKGLRRASRRRPLDLTGLQVMSQQTVEATRPLPRAAVG